jgi:hypothetical protein
MMRRRDFLEIAGVLAAWAAAIVIIHPNFARTGHFTFTHFTAVSLRAQVLWGALWTWVFGESFALLRMSTLTLAAATIVVIHRLVTRAGVTGTPRVLATLAFAFHPIFLWAACTYMTEVPFVFASALAMYFFLRGFDEDRRAWILAGCAAAILSWFVRQTGVINLVAPLAIALWRRRTRDAAAIGATLAAFVALFFLERDWLTGSPEEFAVHYRMWGESSFRLPQQIEVAYHWGVFNAQNAALFFLPLVAPLAFVRRNRWQLLALAAVTFLIFARVQALIGGGHPMPYFVNPFCCDIYAGNIFVNFGLGSHTLSGTFPFVLPYGVRFVLTYASVVLAGLLVASFLRPPRTNAAFLSLGTALVGTAALLGSGLYVDRYALDSAWSLVVFLPLVIPWESRWARRAVIAALIVIAVFSTFSVAEYHAWNRARWKAFEDLRASGVSFRDIDGGAEVWSLYELSKGDQRMRRINQFGVAPRRFILAFEPLPGYRAVKEYPFNGWAGLHRGVIYVLER